MKRALNTRILVWAVPLVMVVVAAHIIYDGTRKSIDESKSPAETGVLEAVFVSRASSRDLVQLRPALQQMLDPATPPRMRIDLAMKCDRDLTGRELEALLGEVSSLPSAAAGLGWHPQFLHEICRQLHHHPGIRRRFAGVLAGVAGDSQRVRVERDYAIQHLRQVWHHSDDDTVLRVQVFHLFKALAGGSAEVSGPAILSLHFLGSAPQLPWQASHASVSNDEVEPIVTGILRRDFSQADSGSIMAALRIAGDRKLTGSYERIREIAADPSGTTVVRMAAISIVASTGGDSRAFLESIPPAKSPVDEAIRLALSQAR